MNENKEGAPAKEDRCSDCPHQVTYKSILLAKAETRFLGCDIDENIESLIDQIRLTSVSVSSDIIFLLFSIFLDILGGCCFHRLFNFILSSLRRSNCTRTWCGAT